MSAIAKTYVTQEADYFGIKVMIATMAGRVEAVGVASILNALPPDKTLAGSLTAQQFVAAVETNGIHGTAYLIKTDAFIRYCQMHRSPQLDRFHDWVTTVIMDVQNRGSHINTNAGPSAYVPERYKDDPILQMMGVLQDQRVRMLDLKNEVSGLRDQLEDVRESIGNGPNDWTVAGWVDLHGYKATVDVYNHEGRRLRKICDSRGIAVLPDKVCNGGQFAVRKWPMEAIRIWWPDCCRRHNWHLHWMFP